MRARWLPTYPAWAVRIDPLRVVLIALGLRLLCALVSSPLPRDDGTYFVSAAHDLANGLGYLLNGKPTAYWPVGYPFFLAVIFRLAGPHLLVVKLVQSVISVAIVGLGYGLARHLYRREEPARLTAVLLAFMPSQIAFPSLMLSEVLFTALTLAGFICIVRSSRWPWVLASGVCFALAVYVRPIALIMPVLGLLWATPAGALRRLRSGMIVYGVILCMTLPWAVRNERVFHHPVLVSTNFGINLWMGNHPGAPGGYEHTDEMVEANRRIGDEVRFDAYARGRALEFMRGHPAEVLGLMAKRALRLWGSDHDGITGAFPRNRSWQRKVFEPLSDLAYIGVWLLLVGALARRRRPPTVAVAAIAYVTLFYMVTVAEPRYHFPAIPWLVIAAAAAALPPETLAISDSLGERSRLGRGEGG